MRAKHFLVLSVVFPLFLHPAGTANANGENIRIVDDSRLSVKLDISKQKLLVRGPWEIERAIDSTLTARIHGHDREAGQFVCASALAMKAKQFDDGLYAAVELAAQGGMGKLRSKAWLLETIAGRLSSANIERQSNVQPVVLSAARLGALDVKIPETLKGDVLQCTEEFLRNSERSHPTSFYTWSPRLSRIFRQDRMLQSELKGKEGIGALVRLLREDPLLTRAYEQHLALTSSLTNPFDRCSLLPFVGAMEAYKVPSEMIYFFPGSRSHEVTLFEKLYATEIIPEGFNLADELIGKIRSGKINLKPNRTSGWYDYQTWALEPLVVPDRMPESGRITFDDQYKRQLVEMFKGFLALSRETHVKPLRTGLGSGAGAPRRVIDVYPGLSTEPLATFYLRKARSYSFVRKALEATFGRAALKEMHRISETGRSTLSLSQELDEMQEIFSGAYLSVCSELGMDPSTFENVDGKPLTEYHVNRYRQWTKAGDIEVDKDVRMMVPVFYDMARKQWKVWIVLGWVHTEIGIDFEVAPKVLEFREPGVSPKWFPYEAGKETADAPSMASFAMTANGKRVKSETIPGQPDVRFHSESHSTVFPLSMEIYVDRILDRAEFRKVCDKHSGWARGILKELTGDTRYAPAVDGGMIPTPW